MSNYSSSRVKSLQVGIDGYTDNQTVVNITGDSSLNGHLSVESVINSIIVANPQSITSSGTIPEYHNATSWGPLTIEEGAEITVGLGSVWTIREN